VVAEGVEREEQLQRLLDEHCDEAQGYMFSKPLDALATAKVIEDLPGFWKTS